METESILGALGAQPNSGKSTVFNALTSARQYTANYPGVTVDKQMGRERSLSSRVCTSLKRSLYLTFRHTKLGLPVILDLNMMEIVEGRGKSMGVARLSGQPEI